MADEKPDAGLLNEDSPEVTKDDYKALHRIYPELGQGGSLDDIEKNNAFTHIIKNRTKFKDDPFSDDEIRDMSANREKSKKADVKEKAKKIYDNPRSKSNKE